MSADADPSEIIDLLADEYVRAVLDALQGPPRSAPEIARRCGCSEATVYRRLDDLAAAGLVAPETEIDPDGHHRTRYRTRPIRLSVAIDSGGLDGEVSLRPGGPARNRHVDGDGPSQSRGSPAD